MTFVGANRIFALKKFRNSPSQMFYKIGLLKNFKEFSGKHLESLFNAKTCNCIKKMTPG